MIPKIIHYCWFGGNSLPKSAIRYINSWKKYLPNYEIWAWVDGLASSVTEQNIIGDKILTFDVQIVPYTREAYEAKRYAFVSDYARFWILYRYGGLYFDTDVEVIKPIDDIIKRGPFMGCEKPAVKGATPKELGVAPGLGLGVNPGLGLGVNPGLGLYKEILDEYSAFHFRNQDGSLNTTTIVEYTSKILCKHGLRNTAEIQNVADVWIYPQDYFNPKDQVTKRITLTENTHAIHHFDCTWKTPYEKFKEKIARIIGSKLRQFLISQKHRKR